MPIPVAHLFIPNLQPEDTFVVPSYVWYGHQAGCSWIRENTKSQIIKTNSKEHYTNPLPTILFCCIFPWSSSCNCLWCSSSYCCWRSICCWCSWSVCCWQKLPCSVCRLFLIAVSCVTSLIVDMLLFLRNKMFYLHLLLLGDHHVWHRTCEAVQLHR